MHFPKSIICLFWLSYLFLSYSVVFLFLISGKVHPNAGSILAWRGRSVKCSICSRCTFSLFCSSTSFLARSLRAVLCATSRILLGGFVHQHCAIISGAFQHVSSIAVVPNLFNGLHPYIVIICSRTPKIS